MVETAYAQAVFAGLVSACGYDVVSVAGYFCCCAVFFEVVCPEWCLLLFRE